jgi:hypothetical protein
MNGLTDESFVLDTNWAVDFTDGKTADFPDGELFVSVITEMELFAAPFLTPKKEQIRRDFLNELSEPRKTHCFSRFPCSFSPYGLRNVPF